MPRRVPTYLIAALIGVAAALGVMPIPAIMGTGPAWATPGPDQAQTLAAHLAFQSDSWRWPLLDIGTLFWPRGISGALVDFNPLLSLGAKIWTKASGGSPVNLFGAWMALCWVLQPITAVYAARGLRIGWPGAIAAAVLAACWPALLVRMGHLNLCAHFLLLLSLGLVFRRLAQPVDGWRGWMAPTLVMLVAVLVHPYLFQLSAALLAAIPLHAVLARRTGWPRAVISYLASCVLAAGTFMVLSFVTGGKDSGFVFFSMNLLSPVWPQRSGIFGANLPVIDATGGQYEGFNWLGAGVLLLVVVAIVCAAITRRMRLPSLRQPFVALAIVLAGLTLLSLSSQIYAGHALVLDLGRQPWESLFGTFRAPGRAFWPVGYAVMLFAVASVGKLPTAAQLLLLLAAAGLQVADTQPIRAEGRAAWTTGATIPVPPLPAGTTMFTAAPFAGCVPDPTIKTEQPVMLLAAVRAGARTGDIGLGRPPRWFNCGRVESDALELPLDTHESRAFSGAATQARLRTELLGPEAVCRLVSDTILCGRDVVLPAGSAVPSGLKLARMAAGDSLGGGSLAAVLGSGWLVVPSSGEIWSEGARSTLVLEVPARAALALTIFLDGVARPAGGRRVLNTMIGRTPSGSFPVVDGVPATMTLHIPASALPEGVLRVALDIDGDIDPAKYGFTAPVKRAGIILRGVSLAAE